MMELLQQDIHHISVETMRQTFKDYDIMPHLPRRENYLDRITNYKNVIEFTWRDDQKSVIDNFIKFDKNMYIVHAVFGSGKTTLLMGLLIHGIVHKLFRPSRVMFVSFNISIKNEIKRKLTKFGLSSKVTVRTFDSIIYQICKNTGYPHMDLPNFDGKRKHVYNKMFDESCKYEFDYQPEIIFIDECQDLERNTMDVMKRFFPNSKFVLAGDIFQSIQKEPRESVLWHYINKDDDEIFKIYMNETPRVPEKNLVTLKKALSNYYPEFADKINNWKSSNKVSDADIEWRQLKTYTQMYEDLEEFCFEHSSEEVMILTFSSAITVKGAMGDVARFRRFLESNNLHVNKNHKRMQENDFFLTTANSSKGLERDYVIVFLTFPLEKAFINLSDDIVVNLITVALTRAKKKVIMYVPTYSDKFSRVLHLFDACPKPTEKIRQDDKILTDYSLFDYLQLEHTVTELIRQSIIKYDSRIFIKENIKPYNFEKLFDENVYLGYTIQTEEEKAFVGVLIENLITSTWANRWPPVSNYHTDGNPMYSHCSKRIKVFQTKYNAITRGNIFCTKTQFEGIFVFSQLQMAVSNKIVFTLSEDTKQKLFNYWKQLKPKAKAIKPTEGNIKIQSNLKMNLLTGVADVIITKNSESDEGKKHSEITIVEIKASADREWKDDALTQAVCYSLMSGKLWSRIVLLNPFMNERVCYYFNSKKIHTLRNKIFEDIMTFNLNCMLAKNHDVLSKKPKLRVEDCLFIDVMKDDQGNEQGVSVIRMVSPIKCEVLLNKYVSEKEQEEEEMDVESFVNIIHKDSVNRRKQKLCQESEVSLEKIKQEVRDIVASPLLNNNTKPVVYCKEHLDFLGEDVDQKVMKVWSNDERIVLDDEEVSQHDMLLKFSEYDSLCSNITLVSKLFQMFSFY